jgi:putative proteasome-type protease
MLSDSRTNAGVDQINTFRKMATFHKANDRVLVLMSAGNLAITQAVVNLLHEPPEDPDQNPPRIFRAKNMFRRARGRRCPARNSQARRRILKEQGHDFNGTFILGGQINGEEPRLFHIYSAGNFIESSIDTPYFQIGESKYGKPIIDRVISRSAAWPRPPSARWSPWIRPSAPTSPSDRRWISPSSAATSSLATHISIDNDNEYFKMIRTRWGFALQEVFSELPNPNWSSWTRPASNPRDSR